jgi:hypothetical protein
MVYTPATHVFESAQTNNAFVYISMYSPGK